MAESMPAPMTPAASDLRDFPHTPLFRARLFGSTFHSRATDSEWRAGVTLWLKSWDQVPAGSLPDDDIDLCRLAELARDLKTWKKLKAGALRGWVLCTDGRLYHPVVAEGVNNAIEAKAKQRAKTAKARISALEKHLKEATTDADRERITDEIRKIQQTMSQGLSQTLSQGPREGEGKEKEKGLDSSVPDGTGAADAPPGKTPEEQRKSDAWKAIKSLLNEHGMPKAQAGTFIGKLVADYGEPVALQAMEAAIVQRPADPAAWLKASCMTAAGQRTPANEPAWRAEQRARTQQAAPGVAATGYQPADQFFIDVEARDVAPRRLG